MFYVCLVPLTSCFPQGLKFVHRGFTVRRRFPGRNPCERRGFAVLYGLSFKFWRPVRATDKRNLMQFHGFPVTLYLTFPPSLLLLRCNSITGLPAFSKQKKGEGPEHLIPPQHLLMSLFPTPTLQRRPRGGANSSATPLPWLYLASTCPIHVSGPNCAHYVHNTCHIISYLLPCSLFLYTLQSHV
jgi:hypothetical protein